MHNINTSNYLLLLKKNALFIVDRTNKYNVFIKNHVRWNYILNLYNLTYYIFIKNIYNTFKEII